MNSETILHKRFTYSTYYSNEPRDQHEPHFEPCIFFVRGHIKSGKHVSASRNDGRGRDIQGYKG